MNVFVTGATGFVGTYVIRALLERGHTVRALLRPGSENRLDARDDAGVTPVAGDVGEPETLNGALDGADAVVHLVGIIEEAPSKGVTFERMHVEATRNVVEVAAAAGVSRFVHMSACGARGDAPSRYLTTKWAAEEIVRGAGFAHGVVFKPSLLFGDPDPHGTGAVRPEFATRLWTTLVRPFPVLPVFGDGRYAVQPIHVDAVARAFAQAIDLPAAAGRTFVAAGPERIPYDDVLDRIAQGAGRKPKPKLHLPLGLSRLMVNTLGRAHLLPIQPAQFEMLVEGNTGDPTDFFATFPVETPRFDPEHLRYVVNA